MASDLQPFAPVLSASFVANLTTMLPRILQTPGAMPEDWQSTATTYDLPRFDSEEKFAARLDRVLAKLVAENVTDAAQLCTALSSCGLPYDYARLGQPLSTVFELWLAAQANVQRAVSFASVTKPWLAVIENPERTLPVRVYADGELPISAELRQQLTSRGVKLFERFAGTPPRDPQFLTVLVRSVPPLVDGFKLASSNADAVCYPVVGGGVLLIADAARIAARGIQIVRKRTVSALLAADAHRELLAICAAPALAAEKTSAATCDQEMKQLFPEVTNALYFCTGLAAEAAVFAAAVAELGSEPVTFFYAANGYGGTGQLITDLLAPTTNLLPAALPVIDTDEAGNPRTLVDGIVARLSALEGKAACIFIETPTNPQLQVHDMGKLTAAVRAYHTRWNKRVPVLVDTTLAPLYPALHRDIAGELPFVLVKSGSKYFTKGKTTLGVAACGDNALAQAILARAAALGRDADSFAKPEQLTFLREGLRDLRPRMAAIAAHTSALADGIRNALAVRGHTIELYAMDQAQAKAGLACGLISFYLPPASTDYPDLVDEFVASVLAAGSHLAKSRVSYGQSSSDGSDPSKRDWFYIINPQESTQGSLTAAVKNAQKRNNVQICRISVPANGDVAGLLASMEPFFDKKYGPRA